jgi:hypothetical protein
MRIGFRPTMMESGIMRVIGMEATDGSSTTTIGIVITTVITITTGTIITTGTTVTAEMSTMIITTADDTRGSDSASS